MLDITVSPVELKTVLKELYSVTGINFSDYSFSFLKRRTEEFMKTNNIKTVSDFIYKLNKSSAIVDKYTAYLFVPNSELFRDAEMWNFLESKIFSRSSGKHGIKIWFPYCKDGKELFSLKYMLGKSVVHSEVDILVSAVTEKHVNIIKSGLFSNSDLKFSVKNIDLLNSALDRDDVFTGENGIYVVKHNFTGTVNYEVSAFMNDEYVLEFDFIFCRNAFIYFNSELQVKAEKILNRALKKGGYLSLGFCEKLISEKAKFKKVSKDLSIYKKKTLS